MVAADQTFKDVIGDAIRERDAIDGLDRSAPAASIEAMAELSQTFGIDPNDTRESVEQEFFSHSLIPAAEWPALIEILESRLGHRQEAHRRACRPRARPSGRERIDNYLKVFCTAELAAAQEYRHQEARRQASRLVRHA